MEDEEIIEQSGNTGELEQEQTSEENSVAEPEPLVIETRGKWQPFEAMTGQTLEVGKTYEIKIQGQCEFMISKDRPTFGFGSNKFTYTKDNENRLWIKTGATHVDK